MTIAPERSWAESTTLDSWKAPARLRPLNEETSLLLAHWRPALAAQKVTVAPPPGSDTPAAHALARLTSFKLSELASLPAGWDGPGSVPPSRGAMVAAVEVVFALALNRQVPPQFFPLSDGGLQVEWHAVASIEVEIDNDGALHALATAEDGTITENDELRLDDAARVHGLVHQLELMDKRLQAS